MAIARANHMVDVAIVGGGIAGLTVAYDLHRLGLRPLLIEARSRLGGVIHTERVDGLLLEAGPDALLAQKPAGLALCRELGLGPQLVPTLEPRTAFVLRGGRLHALPAASELGIPLTREALDELTMLSPEGRDRIAQDLERPSPPSVDADLSIGAVLERRFGAEFVAAIAQPLLGGIHAGDVYRLSMRALFPALADADATAVSLLEALRQRRRSRHPEGAFRALNGGMGTLVDALVAALPRETIRIDSPVLGISSGQRFLVRLSGRAYVEARALVVAVPAWQAACLLHGLDDALADRCTGMASVSSATISLAYGRHAVGHPLIGMGFVVPRGEASTRLLAVSWVTSKWPRRAPGDQVLIRAFAGGALDQDVLSSDDATLIEQSHRDLRAILDLRAAPLVARVYRWDRASPQYEPGHLNRVARIDALVARWPGLFLTGSAFRGIGIPDTIEDARRTARGVCELLGSGVVSRDGRLN